MKEEIQPFSVRLDPETKQKLETLVVWLTKETNMKISSGQVIKKSIKELYEKTIKEVK